MSLPRFLLGMLGVLFVFAIATYVATLSVWTTFIQTLLCAVLIQLGYFVAVLFLVWRGKDKKQDQASSVAPQSPADEKSGSKVRPLSGAERPRHF
jgi:exopolysaccharide production repressor protein